MSTLFRQKNNTSFFQFACLTFVYFVNSTSVQPKGEEEIQEEEQLQVSETKHKGYGGGGGYSQPIIYMVPYTVPSYGGYGGQGGYGGGGYGGRGYGGGLGGGYGGGNIILMYLTIFWLLTT